MLQSEEKSEWKLLLSPGIFRAVIIGAAIAILGAIYGSKCRIVLRTVNFRSQRALQRRFPVLPVAYWSGKYGHHHIGTFNHRQDRQEKAGLYWCIWYDCFSFAYRNLLFNGRHMESIKHFPVSMFSNVHIFTAGSISAVIFVFLSEMYPTRIRGTAMSIAGLSLWIGTYLIGQLTPWMLETLTPAGTFFLFGIMCIPYMLIVWKLMPETAGKSLEEIERFWMKGKNSSSSSL